VHQELFNPSKDYIEKLLINILLSSYSEKYNYIYTNWTT